RAPKWMSELGLEWIYRLITEPKRLWKRYLVHDLSFFWLLLKDMLSPGPSVPTRQTARNRQ
ncbi:MAG: WecB/TagA/CpsF family glycosyltransferase, partial [Cyanobacteria bacterium P01_D01_bin.44]